MKLQELYPEQFDACSRGTGVEEGWQPIVERACRRIREELTAEEMESFRWVQIKQKFGRLRMYCDTTNREAVNRIIAHAQMEAATTCEVCGGEGWLRDGGYVQTLCDRHAAERVRNG